MSKWHGWRSRERWGISVSEGRGSNLRGAAVKDVHCRYLDNATSRIAHTDVILHSEILQRLH